nr:receptor-like protein 11 [Setaria viridis]
MDMDGAMCTRWWRVALIAGLLGLIEPSSSRGDLPDLWTYASEPYPSWVEDESTKHALFLLFQNLAAALKDQLHQTWRRCWPSRRSSKTPTTSSITGSSTPTTHAPATGRASCAPRTPTSPIWSYGTNACLGHCRPGSGPHQPADLANTISGPIPDSIGRLRMLEILDMSSNKLNGTIPSSLGNLKNLNNLALQNNVISGHIPHSVGRLVMLDTLDMSNNRLTGTILSSFGHLKNLNYLGLQNNAICNKTTSFIISMLFLSWIT